MSCHLTNFAALTLVIAGETVPDDGEGWQTASDEETPEAQAHAPQQHGIAPGPWHLHGLAASMQGRNSCCPPQETLDPWLLCPKPDIPTEATGPFPALPTQQCNRCPSPQMPKAPASSLLDSMHGISREAAALFMGDQGQPASDGSVKYSEASCPNDMAAVVADMQKQLQAVQQNNNMARKSRKSMQDAVERRTVRRDYQQAEPPSVPPSVHLVGHDMNSVASKPGPSLQQELVHCHAPGISTGTPADQPLRSHSCPTMSPAFLGYVLLAATHARCAPPDLGMHLVEIVARCGPRWLCASWASRRNSLGCDEHISDQGAIAWSVASWGPVTHIIKPRR